jgi:hypothetical protein
MERRLMAALALLGADRHVGAEPRDHGATVSGDRHVGRDLLTACENHFRTLGLKTVVIGALSQNARAVNAYHAAGYADYAVNLRKVL